MLLRLADNAFDGLAGGLVGWEFHLFEWDGWYVVMVFAGLGIDFLTARYLQCSMLFTLGPFWWGWVYVYIHVCIDICM